MRPGEISYYIVVGTIALIFGLASQPRGVVALASLTALVAFVALIWLEG